MSLAQSRMWFLNRFDPTSAANNIPGAIRLSGDLSVDDLEAALCDVTIRHEVLRTVVGFAARHPDALLVVLGDHQPAAFVSGDPDGRDVPVHVIASNPALLERFESAGFVAGLRPPSAPLGPTHALTPILIDAFGRTD